MNNQEGVAKKEDTLKYAGLSSLCFIVVAVLALGWLNEQVPPAKAIIKKESVRIKEIAAKDSASKEARYLAASEYQQQK